MFHTVVLALLQSVAEFLPVSSSGHLVLMPLVFDWQPKGLAFDVALHVGTLGAVVFYFRSDVKKLFLGLFDCCRGRFRTSDARLLLFLCAASVPALVAGFFIKSYAQTVFRSPHVVAATLIFYAVLLYWADRNGKNDVTVGTLTFKQAMLIGTAQILALIPGTSRSGITMAAGRFLGVKREDAARFSMLLSLPTIGAAGMWALYVLMSGESATPVPVSEIAVGMGVAFVGGVFAVSFLMNWLKRFSFALFCVYRIILGILLFVFL